MDIEKSKILLESLWDRIERDGPDGKWKLTGPISAQERDALGFLLKQFGIELPEDTTDTAQSHSVAAPAILPEVSLNMHVTSLQTAEHQEVIMCLDFGTAMSKAFAMHSGNGKPIGLELGKHSGYTEAVYPMPSSIFISGNGRVFLGHEANAQSLQDQTPGRQRFDSPKQELSQGIMTDLSSVPVPQAVNPSGVPFTKEELITLYLAYLTDMSCAELKNKGLSRYVRRRFARPCWDSKRVLWAEKLLRVMLGRAQILADTFEGQWNGGIDARKLRATFNRLSGISTPGFLIAEGVAEPVAAASSLVIQGEPHRMGFLVIDVGAGTTDFGMFVVVERADSDKARMFQVPGSIHAVGQAGDTIDNMLRAVILKKQGIDLQGSYGQRQSAELSLRIRQFKETLFRDGKLRYSLADDAVGEIELNEFLTKDEVTRFSSSLEQALQRTLDATDASYLEGLFSKQALTVVLTGGGARLPMVKHLAKGLIESRGFQIHTRAAPNVPGWITDDYQEFESEYPQLAVAMGGASPNLPEMGPEFAHFGGGITRPTYVAGNLPLKGV